MREALHYPRRIRWLIQWLVLSVSLNIGLLLALAMQHLPFSKLSLSLPSSGQEWTRSHLGSLLHSWKRATYKDLIGHLRNAQSVEHGFTIRDCAISYLRQHYGFEVARALEGEPQELRVGRLGEEEITLIAGLSERDFQLILQLAENEPFPVTASGALMWLHREKETLSSKEQESLRQLITLSETWKQFYKRLQKAHLFLPIEELFNLVREIGWNSLEKISKEPEQVGQEREKFLLWLAEGAASGSIQAADWLMKHDAAWALRKLDERAIKVCIQKSHAPPQILRHFLQEVLSSPRSDRVRLIAAQRLYELEGTSVSQNLTMAKALPQLQSNSPGRTALPLATVNRKVVVEKKDSLKKEAVSLKKETSTQPHRVVYVEQGETLWKVSQKYRCEMQEIRRLNRLQGDALIPGSALILPPAKGSKELNATKSVPQARPE